MRGPCCVLFGGWWRRLVASPPCLGEVSSSRWRLPSGARGCTACTACCLVVVVKVGGDSWRRRVQLMPCALWWWPCHAYFGCAWWRTMLYQAPFVLLGGSVVLRCCRSCYSDGLWCLFGDEFIQLLASALGTWLAHCLRRGLLGRLYSVS